MVDGGGFRSRMEMLAPWDRRWRVVLRPRPEEPPDMMNVRSLRCILFTDLVAVYLLWRSKGKDREVLEARGQGARRNILRDSM